MRQLSALVALGIVTVLSGGLAARSYAYRESLTPIIILTHIGLAAFLGLAYVYRGRLDKAVLSLFALQLVLGLLMSLQRFGLMTLDEVFVTAMSGLHFLLALLILLRLS
jgi:hypothetical protein